jgi:hypothetical protein
MPKKYTVRVERVINKHIYAKAGEVVYDYMGCDYGLSGDDRRLTGDEHTSVTKQADGSAPSFTIPKHHLEEIQEDA